MSNLNEQQFAAHQTGHRPMPDGPGLHEAHEAYPDIHEHPEYYTHRPSRSLDPETQRYNRTAQAADRETLGAMRTTRGKPEAKVTMYRAAPKNIDAIHTGDWVTPSRHYAQQHLESNGQKDWAVHAVKGVQAQHLRATGDYIHEYGYAGPTIPLSRKQL